MHLTKNCIDDALPGLALVIDQLSTSRMQLRRLEKNVMLNRVQNHASGNERSHLMQY